MNLTKQTADAKTAEVEEVVEVEEVELDDSIVYAGIFFATGVPSLRIGEYQFEAGSLKLVTAEEVEKFESLLKTIDFRTRNCVSKLDIEKGEEIARLHAAKQAPVVSKVSDSASNASASEKKLNEFADASAKL